MPLDRTARGHPQKRNDVVLANWFHSAPILLSHSLNDGRSTSNNSGQPKIDCGDSHGCCTYEERQPEPTQEAANIVAASLPKQVTTTTERTLPEPDIFYPTMAFNKANILEMMPLTIQQPRLSPQSILGWPLLLDVDRPSFREWDKRIGTE